MAPRNGSRARGRASRGTAPRASMRGGTVLGFMIGLVVGLAIAVVVALFVTRAPVPFVNKAGRAPDRVLEPRTPADAPDPNKPLYSKNQPVPAPERQAQEAPQDRGSILDRLFGRQSESQDGDRSEGAQGGAAAGGAQPGGAQPGAGAPIVASRPSQAPAGAAKGEAPASDAPAASRPADERSGYLLQAGAFRGREEADGMRARLALLGFEARVLSAEVNGQSMFRVRVGPFAQLDDMNNARARLAENGIEASVVRQR